MEAIEAIKKIIVEEHGSIQGNDAINSELNEKVDKLLKRILQKIGPEQRHKTGLISLIVKDFLDLLGIVGEISELKQKQSSN